MQGLAETMHLHLYLTALGSGILAVGEQGFKDEVGNKGKANPIQPKKPTPLMH